MRYVYNDYTNKHESANPFAKYAWVELAKAINEESSLLPCTSRELENRWLNGRAVCAVDDRRIVGYVSFVGAIDESLKARLGVFRINLPEIDLFESTTCWTHHGYRGRGIQTALQKLLYDSLAVYETAIGFCAGVGAAPVFYKLNWEIVDWSMFPFISSLGGWFEEEALYVLRIQSYLQKSIKPHCSGHVKKEQAMEHNWDGYLHLWVRDVDKVVELELALQAAFDHVQTWRAFLKDSRFEKVQLGELPAFVEPFLVAS